MKEMRKEVIILEEAGEGEGEGEGAGAGAGAVVAAAAQNTRRASRCSLVASRSNGTIKTYETSL
jgi:hypothetical protein